MHRLILPFALLTLTACADKPLTGKSQPGGPQPPAWLLEQRKNVPETIPPVAPAVLQSIAQLNMPAATRSLDYLELSGTYSNSRTQWPERTEYVLSTDTASGQRFVTGDNGSGTSRNVTWRGLFILSGIEQAKMARSVTVVDSLSFRGDWQHMPVGSELGYTTRGSLRNTMVGTLGTEPKVVNCKVEREVGANSLHPQLKGPAKAVSCQAQRPSLTPVPWDHYYYLVDYGIFYHASTDRHDGVFRDMKISTIR